MKKTTLLFSIVLLVLTSCGAKRSRTLLESGDYDGAIRKSVKALRGNKDKKAKQEFVLVLEEAYSKAAERDLRDINVLLADANPANLQKVFNTYHALNKRQELIRPLLPLKVTEENRTAAFKFEDYSEQLADSKNALTLYLYNNAKTLLSNGSKSDARKVYEDLLYLDKLTPGYRDTKALIDNARYKGTDFVSVYLKNSTNVIIPARLHDELLDFSTSDLESKWMVYHNNPERGIDYSYEIVINFTAINISPEQVKEKQTVYEKQIKVGTKKLTDGRGRVIRDSLGNPIMTDDLKTVKATVTEYRQFKATQVAAQVDYINLGTNKVMRSFPLSSEFVFENFYAKFRGDKRAVDKNYAANFDRRALPFPTNEQMVFDTGEDLKNKIREVITSNKISR